MAPSSQSPFDYAITLAVKILTALTLLGAIFVALYAVPERLAMLELRVTTQEKLSAQWMIDINSKLELQNKLAEDRIQDLRLVTTELRAAVSGIKK